MKLKFHSLLSIICLLTLVFYVSVAYSASCSLVPDGTEGSLSCSCVSNECVKTSLYYLYKCEGECVCGGCYPTTGNPVWELLSVYYDWCDEGIIPGCYILGCEASDVYYWYDYHVGCKCRVI